MIGIDTTGLVIDKRIPGQPGTHALIVGISEYPYLEGGSGPGGLQQFRLPQLSSAAKWLSYLLVSDRAALPVPLATCRLLLGPSLDELHDQPNPSTAQPVTTDDFVMAASGWIQDARRSESEMTIFYFCGHKLQVSREEDILLFQNFGSAIGPSFRGGVSFANIFNGLGQGTIPIAQTQLYFLDGSRHLASRSSLGTLLYGSTDVFDVWLGGPDRRSAAVFQAAAPGDQAYAYRNQVSLFTEALVRGLTAQRQSLRTSQRWDRANGW